MRLNSLGGEDDGVFIVKLGGSIVSSKDDYCVPKPEAIGKFARIIRLNWKELDRRLILVLGGGSYGSGVAYRYGLRETSRPWENLDLYMVTEKMFELLSLVATIFRREGVPCFPFQASSYLISMNGRPERFFLEPIKHALKAGILPILAGDLVFDTEKGFVIYSSDRIPELFAGSLPLKRVAMLTNVPGVMDYSSEEPHIVRRVTNENRERVLGYAGPSKGQDVSGGMKNKVEALLTIASFGVESLICDGRDPEILMSALFDRSPAGTIIERVE